MNFDEISKKVKKLGKNTVEEVQKMNEVRVLNGKINDAKKQISTIYSEIGKKLYEQYKEAPFDGFETEIGTINEKKKLIDQLQEQIRQVKCVVLCPCCGVEVAQNERFCSNCGAKLPETETPEEEDAIIVDAEDVEEYDAENSEAEDSEPEFCDAEGGEEEEAAEGSDEPETADTEAETVENREEPMEEPEAGQDTVEEPDGSEEMV